MGSHFILIPPDSREKIVGDYELQDWAEFLASQGDDDTVKGGIKVCTNRKRKRRIRRL